MLLSDFNYFFNKAINQYINKNYNIFDINLLNVDNLRVLKSEANLPVKKVVRSEGKTTGRAKLFDATYEVYLPDDYLHILNCICVFKVKENFKCYDRGDYVLFAAKRLTADSWSLIQNDYYNRPLPERPYYYIHNVNTSIKVPTNPYDKTEGTGTDMVGDYNSHTTYTYTILGKTGSPISGVTIDGSDFVSSNGTKYPISDYDIVSITETPVEGDNSNFPRDIKLSGIGGKATADAVEKETAYRYGNASKVRCEIRYGHDTNVFELVEVYIDYIKTPQYIRLTQEQVNLTKDTSQIMEFPDYVCQEIINELVHLVMENTADPRLPSNIQVTLSIANPVQQLAPQQRGN